MHDRKRVYLAARLHGSDMKVRTPHESMLIMKDGACPTVARQPWVSPTAHSDEAFTQLSLGCGEGNSCYNAYLNTRLSCSSCGFISKS